MKILECLKSAVKAGTEIYNVVMGFYKKVSAGIKAASAAYAGIAIYIVDLIIAFICNYPKFVKAVEYLIRSIQTNGNQSLKNFGGFVGMMANAIGTASMTLDIIPGKY